MDNGDFSRKARQVMLLPTRWDGAARVMRGEDDRSRIARSLGSKQYRNALQSAFKRCQDGSQALLSCYLAMEGDRASRDVQFIAHARCGALRAIDTKAETTHAFIYVISLSLGDQTQGPRLSRVSVAGADARRREKAGRGGE